MENVNIMYKYQLEIHDKVVKYFAVRAFENIFRI